MSVNHEKKEYLAAKPFWKRAEDVCGGEDAVRAGNYLLTINPDDTSEQNHRRNADYKRRAVFYPAAARTLQGLLGLVYESEPLIELPQALGALADDADGCGVTLSQQSRAVAGELLSKGRAGLFVDYPAVDKQASKADQAAGQVRPTVLHIGAEAIINWRLVRVGGVQKLGLVVMRESYERLDDDGFKAEVHPQFRVLRLDDAGLYRAEVWRESEGDWAVHSAVEPTRASGARWDTIPFTFVGAKNNDCAVDPAPLRDLITLNLAHYRNSADYESSVYHVGQPQPVVTGLDQAWVNNNFKGGVKLGSSSTMVLPEGATFTFAQVAPNSMAHEAMGQKERQMVAMGAHLLEQNQQAKTATEASNDHAAKHSILSLVASNLSAAYTKALSWTAEFVGDAGDCVFEIDQSFSARAIDAQAIGALVAGWQAGAIPRDDVTKSLQHMGVIDEGKSAEQVADECEEGV